IRQILDLVKEHELSEFELQQENFKIRVKKDGLAVGVPPVPSLQAPPATAGAPAVPAPVTPPAPLEPAPPEDVSEVAGMELAVVKSPIVGTFYRSQEPGLPPFVEIGSAVKRGQVLCIIEAMKLMNEIESEYDGVVSAIYVENGQPVQYGERLFAIRTR
ncbi:MAG: acetyl-CoA carboxylase biotin carboxyl carrier protein, partial [Acidobacteria bacterium]|nr:acetyl-CoA carboxylase biotin carboxyl carrier protein [Acidobacteriota bacterium]